MASRGAPVSRKSDLRSGFAPRSLSSEKSLQCHLPYLSHNVIELTQFSLDADLMTLSCFMSRKTHVAMKTKADDKSRCRSDESDEER